MDYHPDAKAPNIDYHTGALAPKSSFANYMDQNADAPSVEQIKINSNAETQDNYKSFFDILKAG